MCTVFDSIKSNIDGALSINSSAVLVFGEIKVHHKDWLTYSLGTDGPGEYSFSISNDPTQLVNFATRIPDCNSPSPTLLNLFFSFDASIYSAVVFPQLGNSDHVAFSFFIDIPSNLQRDARFHCIAYDYFRTDWDGLRDHLRDVLWKDIFKVGASAAAGEIFEWVQLGIAVSIPYIKYQLLALAP